MNNSEVEGWLKNIPLVTALDTDQERAVMELIGSKGLTVLIGMLLAERQGYYVQLSMVRLGTDEMRAYASVLQGKIQGIERIVETVRELAKSGKAGEDEQRSQ